MKNNSSALIRMLPSASLGLMLMCSGAQAAPITFLLDQSNTLDDGVSYLRVTVNDGTNGAIDFTVEALSSLTSLAGVNFGIQSFAFNLVAGSFAESADVTNLPWGWRARDSERMDGFGLFDIRLQGVGRTRMDSLTFSIDGVDGDTPGDYAVLSTGNADQGHQFFAAHVAGFSTSGGDPWDDQDDHQRWDDQDDHGRITSGFFGGSTSGSEVPLPGAAWLFGAGIAGVLTRIKRRRA